MKKAGLSLSTTFSAIMVRLSPTFFFSTGHKLLDYFSYGQSIFKSSSPSVKDVCRKLGINVATHFEQFLQIYLYLQVHKKTFFLLLQLVGKIYFHLNLNTLTQGLPTF